MSTPTIKPESETPPIVQKKSLALTGWILLVVAILLGIVAAILALNTLNAQEAALKQRLLGELSPKKESTIAVVVPLDNLPANTVLTLSMVARRTIPADSAPAGVILDTDFNKIEYKRLIFPADRGKPLTISMFSSMESPADVLDDKHIALTISVNAENSIDKMLRPGDHVDMLWITPADIRNNAANNAISNLQRTSSSPDGSLARFLGQNLKIIATGKDLSPNGDNNNAEGYSTITLEVTPLQAKKILVAQKSGEIRLDLRGNEKNGTWSKRTVSLHDIIGYPRAITGVEYIAGGSSANGTPDIGHVLTTNKNAPLTSSPLQATAHEYAEDLRNITPPNAAPHLPLP